jgi:hypothetical protein
MDHIRNFSIIAPIKAQGRFLETHGFQRSLSLAAFLHEELPFFVLFPQYEQ